MSYVHRYTPPTKEEVKNELLEPDWYEFEIVDAFETNAEGEALVTRHGDPFMKLRVLELASGIVLYHYLFFSEKSAARINAFLHATGATLSEGDEVVLRGSTFVGKHFRGKVEITVRDGKSFNQVALVRPSEAPQESPDPQEAESPEPTDLDDNVPF